MKIFLICPVRGVTEDYKVWQENLVTQIEACGDEVHWPPRDTDQVDDIGLRICSDNRQAIEQADMIYVVWDGKSQGCLFDLGMAFAMRKQIHIIALPELTDGKSYQNMITAWEKLDA
jgi:hypothetical protein